MLARSTAGCQESFAKLYQLAVRLQHLLQLVHAALCQGDVLGPLRPVRQHEVRPMLGGCCCTLEGQVKDRSSLGRLAMA